MWRPDWPVVQLSEGEALPALYYHQAIGVIVARFNTLEIYFRHLVGTILGLQGQAIEIALTQVGATTLADMLSAAATELVSDEPVRDELKFAIQLFENNRINRNFLIHSATEFSDLLPTFPKGVLHTKRTAKSRLRVDQYVLPIDALRGAADQIHEAIDYFSQVSHPLHLHKIGSPLDLPSRPPLPSILQNTFPKVDMDTIFREIIDRAK